jgi:hypothetical protein
MRYCVSAQTLGSVAAWFPAVKRKIDDRGDPGQVTSAVQCFTYAGAAITVLKTCQPLGLCERVTLRFQPLPYLGCKRRAIDASAGCSIQTLPISKSDNLLAGASHGQRFAQDFVMQDRPS